MGQAGAKVLGLEGARVSGVWGRLAGEAAVLGS